MAGLALGCPAQAEEGVLERVSSTRKMLRHGALVGLFRLILIIALVMPMSGATHADDQRTSNRDTGRGDAGVPGDLLRLVNAERIVHGLPSVSRNDILDRAAQWMADDLAGRQMLDHTDSQQRDMATRLRAFGYDRPRLLAENIAGGQETSADVVKSWLRSPPHRANLFQPEVQEAGIGQARSAAGRRYWVLDLAASFTDR